MTAHRAGFPAVLAGAALAALALVASPAAAQDVERGRPVYQKYCAQCHGDDGAGRGPAATRLMPAPRDFTTAKYQIRTTPTGSLPTDEDIVRVIEIGIPGTAMPAFPNLSDQQIADLVAVLKSFSPKFETQQPAPPLDVPSDPGFDEGNVEAARELYAQIGCARCHGDEGRGDGMSAPTLRDDWGQFVRAADLTRPWTFNGGATRQDVFRSLSTGLNGTPMAGFESALTVEQRWQLVDFITAISDGQETPGYANLATAVEAEGGLDLARGAELFAEAPVARFPLVGQIVQPGRNFQTSIIAVEVRAVYDREDIAFEVSWHDIVADTGGENRPDLALGEEEELLLPAGTAGPAQEGDTDPFADEVAADPFADVAADPFAGEVATAADPFADELGGTAADPAATGGPWGPNSEFSDAIALQFPRELPPGIRLPYFLFGDPQNPVDLWFVDLARPEEAQVWIGRGSENLEVSEDLPPEVAATYEDGRWVVRFKRQRSLGQGIAFPDDTFVPVAFSTWDGFHRERGNRRGLTSWFYVYVPPANQPSPWMPMAKAAGVVLLVELVIIFWVRRRKRATALTGAAPSPQGAAS